MPITYKYASNNDRYAQLYRLLELNRLEHNKKGQQYKLGIISLTQWKNYLEQDFQLKQDEIINEMLKYRNIIKNDSSINTSLTDVII